MRAGLARLRQRQHHVGGFRQRRVGVRGHRDQADAEAARIVGEVFQLRRLARPGQRDDHVVVGDHAEVAVARFARMHEQRRRAGRGEGRGDLAPDMAGFAHAGDDDAALRGADQLDRGGEGRAQPVAQGARERVDAAALGVERAQRGIDRRLRAGAAHVGWPGSRHTGLRSLIGRRLDSTERAARQACAGPNVNAGVMRGFSGFSATLRAPPPGRFRPRRRRCGGGAPRRCPRVRARSLSASSPGGSRIAAIGLSGFQCHGLVGPKMAIVGVPIAADTCIKPESLVTEMSAAASARIALRKSLLVRSRTRLPRPRRFVWRAPSRLGRRAPRPKRRLA